MPRPGCLRLALLAVLFCCLPASRASQYDPHPPGSTPSSFEGWYIRLTPLAAHPRDAAAPDMPPPLASLALVVAAMPCVTVTPL